MTRTKMLLLLAGLVGLSGCNETTAFEPAENLRRVDTVAPPPPPPVEPRRPHLSPESVLTARPGGAR